MFALTDLSCGGRVLGGFDICLLERLWLVWFLSLCCFWVSVRRGPFVLVV